MDIETCDKCDGEPVDVYTVRHTLCANCAGEMVDKLESIIDDHNTTMLRVCGVNRYMHGCEGNTENGGECQDCTRYYVINPEMETPLAKEAKGR